MLYLLLFRLTHPEVPYTSGATTSTNNPEFVEDLSQGQLLQNESSNTAEGNEQRHEEEVSSEVSLLLVSEASEEAGNEGVNQGIHHLAFLHSAEFSVSYLLFYIDSYSWF